VKTAAGVLLSSFLELVDAGRPGYALVGNSNLDWNQSPQVEDFRSAAQSKRVLLDEYGFSDPE
jgi:hypothetical protein